MFADAEFCDQCGTRRARQAGPANAACPGCRTPMAAVEIGGTSVLECPACDGLWVEARAFERICADRESQAAVLHRRAAGSAAAEHRVSYRPCVSCGTMMNRVNFAQISGVVVDVCRAHGTFLDGGELQRIVSFIQGGGLERTRQRQMEDLRAERTRVQMLEARARRLNARSAQDSTAFSAGAGFTDLVSWLSDS
jgi:Zn-finger nucleic acid-binding protein